MKNNTNERFLVYIISYFSMDKLKLIVMNRRFDETLNKVVSLNGQNTQFLTKTSYTQMIKKLKHSEWKVNNK